MVLRDPSRFVPLMLLAGAWVSSACTPLESTVVYSVSSSTPDVLADITYTNETFGDSRTGQVTLPHSETVVMSPEWLDVIGLTADTPLLQATPADLVLEIQVDGETVERQVNENQSYASLYYAF